MSLCLHVVDFEKDFERPHFKQHFKSFKNLSSILVILQNAETKDVVGYDFMDERTWQLTQKFKRVYFHTTYKAGSVEGVRYEPEIVYQFFNCTGEAVLIGIKDPKEDGINSKMCQSAFCFNVS